MPRPSATPSALPVPPVPPDPALRIAFLERELRQRATTIATLRRELVRLVEAPTVVSAETIDGLLTITTTTGAVLQRRPHVIDTPEEFGYTHRWDALPPAPDTPAAIVDALFADDANLPAALYALPERVGRAAEQQHHAPTFRGLASLALRGMAVVTGDES